MHGLAFSSPSVSCAWLNRISSHVGVGALPCLDGYTRKSSCFLFCDATSPSPVQFHRRLALPEWKVWIEDILFFISINSLFPDTILFVDFSLLCPANCCGHPQESIHPSMYCSQWFITIFAYSLPFDLVLRIWDAFMLEGIKVVFRVGLALLMHVKDQLMQMPFERLVVALRHVREVCFFSYWFLDFLARTQNIFT